MTMKMGLRTLLPAMTLIAGLGAAGLGAAVPALAATPSQESAAMGATTGLGWHHRFPTMAAAQANCPGDAIVWASGNKLTYKVVQPGAKKPSGHGFYACKLEADSAGFHELK